MMRRFWWLLLALFLIAAGVLFWRNHAAGSNAAYQAVFLNNGQVYFGKLSGADEAYASLKDVYYLQVAPAQSGGAQSGQLPSSSINLVKLGSELHGPTDAMRINRMNILFIEDLKPDSKVVQAIGDMKKNGQ
jgi:hypothetical protein